MNLPFLGTYFSSQHVLQNLHSAAPASLAIDSFATMNGVEGKIDNQR
jgi:hypothetical protein